MRADKLSMRVKKRKRKVRGGEKREWQKEKD